MPHLRRGLLDMDLVFNLLLYIDGLIADRRLLQRVINKFLLFSTVHK